MRSGIVQSFLVVASVALVCGAVIGEESQDHKAVEDGFGRSVKQAIEVCLPEGVRDYLRRLRCSNGKRPKATRVGQAGNRNSPQTDEDWAMQERQIFQRFKYPAPSPDKDFHIVDEWSLKCKDGKHRIYFDVYHCTEAPPQDAPAGFTLLKE